MDDLDLGELLRATAPQVELDGSAGAARQVARAVARRRRIPGRSRWRAVAGAVAALSVPAVAVAGVLHFGALTGHFGSAGKTENDTSQYIDMCAGDIGAYVATLTPRDVALAPGATWSSERARFLDSSRSQCPPHGPGQVMQATGIRSDLLLQGTCTWEGWALRPQASAADLDRADRNLAAMTRDVAHVQLADGRTGTSAAQWTAMQRRYAGASRAYLSRDFRINCQGHDVSASTARGTGR